MSDRDGIDREVPGAPGPLVRPDPEPCPPGYVPAGTTPSSAWIDPLAGTELAGFWRRAAALVVDGIIVNVVTTILTAAQIPVGLTLALGLLYYVVGNGRYGLTIGRAAMGIRLRDVDHDRPIGLWRAVVRSLGSVVSAAVVGLGYLWCIWDGRRQTWHDHLADSVVVRTAP